MRATAALPPGFLPPPRASAARRGTAPLAGPRAPTTGTGAVPRGPRVAPRAAAAISVMEVSALELRSPRRSAATSADGVGARRRPDQRLKARGRRECSAAWLHAGPVLAGARASSMRFARPYPAAPVHRPTHAWSRHAPHEVVAPPRSGARRRIGSRARDGARRPRQAPPRSAGRRCLASGGRRPVHSIAIRLPPRSATAPAAISASATATKPRSIDPVKGSQPDGQSASGAA